MSVDAEPLARDARLRPLVSGRERRSALLLAVGVAHLARLSIAWLASYPVVAQLNASGILEFESGDGKLFEPGGLYLLEVLLSARGGLAELVAPTAALLVAGALAGVLPEWMLLRALSAGSPATRVALFPALPRLGALALASWLGRGLLAGATGALALTARSYFESARDERLTLLGAGVVVLLGLLAWACLSILHDLAAIEVVRAGASPLLAIERALAVARRRALPLTLRYAGWTLASGAVLVGGAAAAAAFDVSQGGTFAPIAALAVHQAALLGQIGLHAGWLSSALAATTPRPDDRRALERAQADAFL
jgi:hypothetical protein